MSGMKFRRTCSVCNTTFFSPDRKAAYCPKCLKKRIVKHVPEEVKVRPSAAPPVRVAPRPAPAVGVPRPPVRKASPQRVPRAAELSLDLRNRIVDLFEHEYKESGQALREVHAKIATKLWVKRQLVAEAIRDHEKVQETNVTEQQRERAVEMYQRFVETGYRPEGGRRRAISAALGVAYKQVMKIIRDWSLAEYAQSPTPTPSRQQLFEIEKMYWDELQKQRHRLTEMPARIAEQLGYVTRWQVLRWLDVLHDDERAFANVPEPPPEVQQQILEDYTKYLASESPPEQGLHYDIAGRLDKVTPRQVHKVLQTYRHKQRTDYPLL